MYKNVFGIIRTYWLTYGGWRALLSSPYLHAALVLTLLSYPIWIKEQPWWETAINVLPNLLGFTLIVFAIFINFGDEKFRTNVVTESEEDITAGKVSIYEDLCATFVHFILIQFLALIFALLQKSWNVAFIDVGLQLSLLPCLLQVIGFIGYVLFCYAVCLMLATCMHLFRIARIYSIVTNYDTRKKVLDAQKESRQTPKRHNAL